MDVHVLVHLDRADDDWVWWAESPEVPGFYAAESSLQALLIRAEWTLANVLAEQSGIEDVTFRHELVGAPPLSEGVQVVEDPDQNPGRRWPTVASVVA